MRERKFRKEKPFAVMARDLAAARSLVELGAAAEALLTAAARPIVLAPARRELPGVAPGNRDLGVMLPYTPLHHLLFAAGAPEVLVMTSANRSSEPIAYRDKEPSSGSPAWPTPSWWGSARSPVGSTTRWRGPASSDR